MCFARVPQPSCQERQRASQGIFGEPLELVGRGELEGLGIADLVPRANGDRRPNGACQGDDRLRTPPEYFTPESVGESLPGASRRRIRGTLRRSMYDKPIGSAAQAKNRKFHLSSEWPPVQQDAQIFPATDGTDGRCALQMCGCDRQLPCFRAAEPSHPSIANACAEALSLVAPISCFAPHLRLPWREGQR